MAGQCPIYFSSIAPWRIYHAPCLDWFECRSKEVELQTVFEEGPLLTEGSCLAWTRMKIQHGGVLLPLPASWPEYLRKTFVPRFVQTQSQASSDQDVINRRKHGFNKYSKVRLLLLF